MRETRSRTLSKRSWSRLPDDLSERVLSFLSVPALCRCRSVCRRWNELVRKQSFLDLCDLNEGNRQYLFLTRYLSPEEHPDDGWSAVDDDYRETMCFLDLEERRWYSIKADMCRSLRLLTDMIHWNVPRLMAVDGGLVCEFFVSSKSSEHKLAMFDPLAPSRCFDQELPASTSDGKSVFGKVVNRGINSLPVIVTVVDAADRSFRVFLMNREQHSHDLSGFFVYESATDAWRSLELPSQRLGVRVGESRGRMLEESAVFFQGNLYAVFWNCCSETNMLLSFNLEENSWNEVLVFEVKNPEFSQLVVYGDRMFMAVWSYARRPTPLNYSFFEIREVLVDSKSTRSVVKIPNEDLECKSGESLFGIKYGFPLDSHSVVLISRRTGRLLTYDLRSGAVGALPAHPLRRLSEPPTFKPWEVGMRPPHYRAKLTNLSLRNMLIPEESW
jgi:hypothetical protein